MNGSIAESPKDIFGHGCVSVADTLLLIWGGIGIGGGHRDPSEIFAFHTVLRKWFHFQTKGAVPLKSHDFCAIGTERRLFIFGGVEASQEAHNGLYCLDFDSLSWSDCLLRSRSKVPTPRSRCAGWEHDQKLYIFGGFGLYVETGDEPEWEEAFLLDRNGFSRAEGGFDFCNNQLLMYDPQHSVWTTPSTTGTIPSARSGHAAVKRSNTVILFGGEDAQGRWLNDLYQLNLNHLVWTDLNHGPRPRLSFSFSAFFTDKVLLFGGLSPESEVLGDVWTLDLKKKLWERNEELESCEKRYLHTGVTVNGSLYIHGGMEKSKDTKIILEQPRTLAQIACDSIVEHTELMNSQFSLPPSLRIRLQLTARQIPANLNVRNLIGHSL